MKAIIAIVLLAVLCLTVSASRGTLSATMRITDVEIENGTGVIYAVVENTGGTKLESGYDAWNLEVRNGDTWELATEKKDQLRRPANIMFTIGGSFEDHYSLCMKYDALPAGIYRLVRRLHSGDEYIDVYDEFTVTD